MTRTEPLDDPREVSRILEAWGARLGWRGPDPYDGLNATRPINLLKRSKTARRIVTQAVKRSPFDLRGLLGIPVTTNSMAIANVLASYARDGFLGQEPERREKLLSTLETLEGLRCSNFEDPCWGYPFPVQTRVFFYPSHAPNTIATAFSGLALVDAYELGGFEHALEVAIGAGDFFLRHVPQTAADGGAYFGYLVGDRTPIHNASMLAAALLARLARHTGRTDFADSAAAAVAYTVGHQRPDGSWPYGERPHLAWIDNFHTGYVLESLLTCARAGIDDGTSAALARGLSFYAQELFLRDGTPKYTPDSIYPIDVQCAAQGIQTFARAGLQNSAHAERAWSVYGYATSHLRRPDGAFMFQRRRFWRNRVAHVRWGAAPMLLALTHLLRLPGRAP